MSSEPTATAIPRIPPIPAAERDAVANELLSTASGEGRPTRTPNLWTTLIRHPGLFRRWIPFGGKLLSGQIPVRDRELMILRTAWRCGAEYEWGQHCQIARDAGVSDDELLNIAKGPDTSAWEAFDAALLRAVDELHDGSCVTDMTWGILADRYEEKQLIELPMLVGQYHLVAFTMNSLRLEHEPGADRFPKIN